jgi:hypothetical protein
LRERRLNPPAGLTGADDEVGGAGSDHRQCEFVERIQPDKLDWSEGVLRQPEDDGIAPFSEAAGEANGKEDHAVWCGLAIGWVNLLLRRLHTVPLAVFGVSPDKLSASDIS